MLENPMDTLKLFPVRKSKAQKQAFRDAVQSYVSGLGYECTIEKGSMGSQNIVIGDPEKAKYVVTAHYDTPANMVVPNLITPCNFLTFLLYQILVAAVMLVPAGMIGVLVGHLADSFQIGYYVWLILVWVDIILVMAGPANKNNANDNTSGVVTVLEIARSMPELYRDRVCFVLFDLEELGLIGSSSYRKAHKKATDEQVILNLDCVGDGEHILFFPTRKAKKDAALMAGLKRVGGWFGEKHIELRERGFSAYPSDQANFPKGVGIAAFHKKKGVGYYCARIHTKKDTVLEETNVNLLRAALTTLISCDSVK